MSAEHRRCSSRLTIFVLGDPRRLRGHQQGPRHAAHAPDVGRQLDPRHRARRRDVHRGRGRQPGHLPPGLRRDGRSPAATSSAATSSPTGCSRCSSKQARSPQGRARRRGLDRWSSRPSSNHRLPRLAGRGGRVRPGPAPDELARDGAQWQPAVGGRHGRRRRRHGDLPAAASTGGVTSPAGWSSSPASRIGGGFGLYAARTVKMTAMPQLVSLFNAVGGGAAALVAIDDYLRSRPRRQASTTIFVVLGIVIGSVTFTGSLIASGKLQGLITRHSRSSSPAGRDPDGAGRDRASSDAHPRPRRGRHARPRRVALVLLVDPRLGPDLRGHDGPADRRRRHAGRDQPPERVHRHGRRDGRLRARQPGADRRGRPRRCIGRDPDQAHGRRDEPVHHEHHGRRLRRRRGHRRGGRRGPAAASGRSAWTTPRSSSPTPSR